MTLMIIAGHIVMKSLKILVLVRIDTRNYKHEHGRQKSRSIT